MAPINHFCLSFTLGLFVSLIFISKVSVPVVGAVIIVCLAIFIKLAKRDRLVPVILAFYFLGVLRPALYWDVVPFLNSISGQPVAESMRQDIKTVLSKTLPEPQASLAYGILFGVSKGSRFDRNFLQELRHTGTAHMVTVSGYNVSIVMGILMNTSILLVNKAFILTGFAGLLLYDVVAGFSASVIRATIMGLYLFLAGVFGRQKNISDALLFSAALILFLSPPTLFDLGFQFSFLAMMAVIYISPILEKVFRFLPSELNKVASATLASQVMIMPISVYSFGQVSIIAPLANVLTFITIPPIMGLTALTVLAGQAPPPLLGLISIPNYVLLDYFVKVVGFLSSLRWASVTI